MSLINGVSLFSNVGIAEIFMKNHGIDIVVANELLEKRANFYQDMYPKTKVIQGDISKKSIFEEILKEAKKKNCQFLIATPPCQGMSVAGKMQENDPRNSLIKYAVKMIKELKPQYIVIENVIGILKAFIFINNEKIKIVDYLNKELKDYFINYKIMDTANHGTPQTRKRAIFLISKNRVWDFPKEQKMITVREAIGHLPSLESGETSAIVYHYAKRHNHRHILCLKHTPSGKTALNNKVYYPQKEDGTRIKGFQTTYKRIEWDKPAPTITMANGSVSSQNNVHPGRLKEDGTYSDARVLTLKEIFILTGLPENWAPPSWASENLIREVIGEAIPPKLIDEILKTIPKD